jgi:arylsulfatase A-like enzyme
MPAGRPNVVVFFTDQQRHDTSGLHGCPLDLTPNFDAWAKRGTHFATAITPQPVCGPARACLQTGKFATAVGDIGCHTNNLPLPPDHDTLAKRARAAGYHTGYFGKWHLGLGHNAVSEEHRGGWQTWLAANAVEACSDAYHTILYDEDEQEVKLPGYRVDATVDAAIRYIDDREQNHDEPFCCMVSLLEPHMQNHRDDYPAPSHLAERYHGRWTPPDLAALPGAAPFYEHLTGGNAQQVLGGYFGMCKRIDDAFGRLMDALQSLGILENTVVVFASDHACHFRTRNEEYKRSCHESSVRTPCMIHGGAFTGGGRIEQPFQLTDLAPTLCDVMGTDAPSGAQGRSALPLVRREQVDWPEESFTQISESCVGRSVRTTRWKYAAHADAKPNSRHAETYTETHLYDLLADPYELCNLVGVEALAEVRQDLKARLLRRMTEAGEPPAKIHDAPKPDRKPGQLGQRELRPSDDLMLV